MKILSLSRAPLKYKAGIPAYCLNLYSNNDFDVTNFSYDINYKLKRKKELKVKGIAEIIFPSQFVKGTIAFSLEYAYSIILNKENFDVIHLQHPDPLSAVCACFSKLFHPKIKIIITWHADIYKSYIVAIPFLVILDFITYSISSKIIFFTPMHLKSSFINRFNFLKKKTELIPNCIPVNEGNINKAQFKRKTIKNKKEFLFLSIGRLVKYKGYEYSIKALSNLNFNFSYYIIGSGPLKNELKILIKNFKLEKKVKLLGEINDEEKNKLLSSADIFLFPSITQSEAYGLVQLEAMAYGLPIINTDLKNGVNYLAPPNIAITCKIKSTYEIQKAIKELTNNEILYERKSSDVLSNFKRFNIDIMRNAFKKIIHEL